MKEVIIQMKVLVEDETSTTDIENELCDIKYFDSVESVIVEEQ